MKQTRSLSELSCLSEYTRLNPICWHVEIQITGEQQDQAENIPDKIPRINLVISYEMQ